MNQLEVYQQIYTKLFKKLKLDKILHYDLTNYEYITLEKSDLIIPFEKILIKLLGQNKKDDNFTNINKAYKKNIDINREIVKEIDKFLKYKNINELLYIFINTINSWIEKYSLQATYNLMEIFSDVIEYNIYNTMKKSIYLLFRLGLFTIVELYDRKRIINIAEWDLFIQIQSCIFDINVSFVKLKYRTNIFGMVEIETIKEKFKKYINFIGLKDYEQFLNNLYHYIIYISNAYIQNNLKIDKTDLESLYSIFVIQCEYSQLLSINKIEEVLKIFVKYNLYDQDGLDLLKEYNSSYTAEYESLLLMKDLIETN